MHVYYERVASGLEMRLGNTVPMCGGKKKLKTSDAAVHAFAMFITSASGT